MRATKYRRYTQETDNKAVKTKKSANGKSKSKIFSFAAVFVVIAVMMIIPTTTLAPSVGAYENVTTVALTEETVVIETTPKEVPKTDVTEPEKRTVEENVTEPETTKATEQTEATEKTTEAVKEKETLVQEVTESTYFEETVETTVPETTVSQTVPDNSNNSGEYLISIDAPDKNYSPKRVTLSAYDRSKIERLVMGEAGSLGFTGAALVAQTIRDSMNRSNTTSVDVIIQNYKYFAPTDKEPNQAVKDAVSFIFDDNGSAVQHRILCFNNYKGGWHETQKFIVAYGNVRFFDFN